MRYLKLFQNTLVDRPFVYVISLLLAIAAMLKWPIMSREARVVMLTFAIGELLFVACHFMLTPSTLLRYLWPSIVSSMVISTAVVAAYVEKRFEKV